MKLQDGEYYLVYCPKWSQSEYAIALYKDETFTTEIGQDIPIKFIGGIMNVDELETYPIENERSLKQNT